MLTLKNIPFVGDQVINHVNATFVSVHAKVHNTSMTASKLLMISCVTLNGVDTLYVTSLPIGGTKNAKKVFKMTRSSPENFF